MCPDLRWVRAERRKLLNQLAAICGIRIVRLVIAEIIPVRFSGPSFSVAFTRTCTGCCARREKREKKQYESHQKLNLRANCTCLGLFADVVTMPPGRRICHRIWNSERRSIRHIEELGAKLQEARFSDRKFFEHRYIEVPKPLRTKNVGSAIAVCICRQEGEYVGAATWASRVSGYIEPARGRSNDHRGSDHVAGAGLPTPVLATSRESSA